MRKEQQIEAAGNLYSSMAWASYNGLIDFYNDVP